MAEAVIGIGANLGEREKNLEQAAAALDRLPHTKVLACSAFYETAPFGVPGPQPDYLNCCIRLETGLSPHTLLGACLGIEAAMGRVRQGEKSARCIDMDVLLYEGACIQTEELTVPHPRMAERAFVLIPLADLFPQKKALGFDFSDALQKVKREGVCLYRG